MNNHNVIILLTIMIMVSLLILFFSKPNTVTRHIYGNNEYCIYEIHDLLTERECKLIIDNSKNMMQPSAVMSSSNPTSNVRTSTNTFLKLNNFDKNTPMFNLLNKIDTITAKISNKPIPNQEPLQVVQYKPNQEYIQHYDCCVPMNSPICKRDTMLHGLRFSTLLIYLNDVKDGGETEFPLLNTKFTPKLGKAIYFFNLTPNQKEFHKLSKHAGLPPLNGDKWVCNKWIRTKQYI